MRYIILIGISITHQNDLGDLCYYDQTSSKSSSQFYSVTLFPQLIHIKCLGNYHAFSLFIFKLMTLKIYINSFIKFKFYNHLIIHSVFIFKLNRAHNQGRETFIYFFSNSTNLTQHRFTHCTPFKKIYPSLI